jgi:hypothetical protein
VAQTEANGCPDENAGNRDHDKENRHVEEGLAPGGGLTAASAESVEDAPKELWQKEEQREDTYENADGHSPA